jgi:hypothetical protein
LKKYDEWRAQPWWKRTLPWWLWLPSVIVASSWIIAGAPRWLVVGSAVMILVGTFEMFRD